MAIVRQRVQSLILNSPALRPLALRLAQRFQLGSYRTRLGLGAVERPNYGYCVYNAALLAKKLGYPRISALEFGVAGGSGLKNLEYHAHEVERTLGVAVEVYGFDTGEGLPEPVDYRDLPYHWKKGFFRMDVEALQRQLKHARLILGNVSETSQDFFSRYDPAPVGAIVHDMDFYSSTAAALEMLAVDPNRYLPRVFCYFDDTIGTEVELYNDFTGQRLAINEFNKSHHAIKLARPYYLVTKRLPEQWFHQIWICHFFEHSRYNDFVSADNQQLA